MVFTTLLGYFILLVFFYLERRWRRGEMARSIQPGKYDRRSSRLLAAAYVGSVLLLLSSWVLSALGLAVLPAWVGWLGVAIALAGLFMRSWANRALGEYYTRAFRVVEGQPIVHAGPYRVIRHPGYLGTILMWLGVAISTSNWIVIAVVLILVGIAYHYRIDSEEKMLIGTLPGYAEYRSRTWRLIPLIY